MGFNIKNAYHHLRMRLEDEHFLQFCMGGEVFACWALPFGLSLSPYFFTHLILVVTRFLRAPESCARAAQRFRFGCLAGNDSIKHYFDCYVCDGPAVILAYLDDFLASMSDASKLQE